MAAVSQTTHSNAFSLMKMLEFRLRFHWSLFLRVQLTIIHHWFREWLGVGQAASHYLNKWWLVYICVTRSQWVNSKCTHMIIFKKKHSAAPQVFRTKPNDIPGSLYVIHSGREDKDGCDFAHDIFKDTLNGYVWICTVILLKFIPGVKTRKSHDSYW